MLRFLFYATFDNKIGPQLPICVPHPFITLKEFNEIAGYIIPRPSLSRRLISFHWKSNIILNFPIRIEDSKYERHAFFFSFGMVLMKNNNSNKANSYNDNENNKDANEGDKGDNNNNNKNNESESESETEMDEIEIESYERILKRLTLIFLSLENDFLYLSQHNKCDHYPSHFEYLNESESDRKGQGDGDYLLRNVLSKIFEGFKTRGECTVNLFQSRKIALSLYNKLSSPPMVYYHDVPVLICDLTHTNCMDNRCDISLQYVLKQINSVNHVKRICHILASKLIDVDFNSIKECIKQLLYYKYIVITDIFKYNNLYIITKNINNFINSPQMQRSLLSFSIMKDIDIDDDDGNDNNNNNNNNKHQLINQIYKQYTLLNGKLTVTEFMKKYKWKQHPILKQFDIHKFVLFGTVNKLIRRIHRFPIIINDKINDKNHEKQANQKTIKKLINLCDGTHCFDEICCELGLNQKEINKLLTDMQYVVLLR